MDIDRQADSLYATECQPKHKLLSQKENVRGGNILSVGDKMSR